MEVLRTEGTSVCFDYWVDRHAVRFDSDASVVEVPSGEVTSEPADMPYSFVQSADPGLTILKLASGNSASFRTSEWSLPYDSDGIYLSTTDGRALFFVGSPGGKDLCIAATEKPPAVLLPPF